jgi:hypothetical protein
LGIVHEFAMERTNFFKKWMAHIDLDPKGKDFDLTFTTWLK